MSLGALQHRWLRTEQTVDTGYPQHWSASERICIIQSTHNSFDNKASLMPVLLCGTPCHHLSEDTHTHTRLTALCPGQPTSAGTRKVKPIWILLKTVSGSGISWAICKSTPCSRQITMPAPHHSVFYRPDALPSFQPTASKHWRHSSLKRTWTINHHKDICLGSAQPWHIGTVFVCHCALEAHSLTYL